MADLEKIFSAISSLKMSVDDNIKKTDEIKNMLVETNKKFDLMEKEITTIKKECTELKKLNKRQSIKVKLLEKEARAKNLVLYGLKIESDNMKDMLSEIVQVFNSKLEVSCLESDITYIRKLGNSPNKPTLLIRFESEKKRNEILYKRFSLKGTNLVVTEDFPKEIREERRVLYKYYQLAREKGEDTKMRYDYVVVNSNKFFYEDIVNASGATKTSQKKKKITPKKRSTRKRSSEKETSQTEDSSRPSTPRTSQLIQWLNTPDRNKLEQVLKKVKTSRDRPISE